VVCLLRKSRSYGSSTQRCERCPEASIHGPVELNILTPLSGPQGQIHTRNRGPNQVQRKRLRALLIALHAPSRRQGSTALRQRVITCAVTYSTVQYLQYSIHCYTPNKSMMQNKFLICEWVRSCRTGRSSLIASICMSNHQEYAPALLLRPDKIGRK